MNEAELKPEADDFDHPWGLEQEPTTFILMWAGDEPPTQTEAVAALTGGSDHTAHVLEELEPPGDGEMLWTIVLGLAELESPVFLYAEPAQPVEPGWLGDEQAERSRWIIGAEAMLDPDDPYGDFLRLIRLLASSFPDAPAIVDANATSCVARQQLEELYLSDEIEPPEEVLWTIHIVGDDDLPESERTVWLHTHGLWRCGKPELEMLQVPHEHVRAAAELINDIASLLLEAEYPDPGESLEIGHGLVVGLKRWQEVASALSPDEPGSMVDREGEQNPHTGARAVICQAGAASGDARWPSSVLASLREGDGVVYRTQRATQRQARLAQHTWDQLATAFASARDLLANHDDSNDDRISFLLKAGLRRTGERDDDGGREHLWFELRRVDGDRAEARLLSAPRWVEHLSEGVVLWIDRDSVSDWTVFTPLGAFGPSALPGLWRAIDELRAGKGGDA